MHLGKKILLGLSVLCLAFFTLLGFVHDPGEKIPDDPYAGENWIIEEIPPGGSIFSVMEKNNIPLGEIGKISFEFGNYVDVTTIQSGDTLKIELSPDMERVLGMVFIQEPTSRHIFRAQGDSLAYFLEELPVQTRQRILRGELQGTLDASLLAMGLTPMEKQQINNGLEADINFAMDAKNGDEFKIFLEERIFEGQKLPGSKIHYVSYMGKNTGLHELFRYEGPEEKSVLNGLYTTEGKSNCATGVGYPLASIHVVSRFGRRIDPFHKRWRMHQGVDYRARYGTPVYAVASGIVTASHYSGGWGNEIRIRHNSGMITQYAHLSRINVRRGQKVVRGQVIGRVGSTGRSTGAHLHFGLMSGGKWINPTNLRMVGATKLTGDRLAEFKQQMQAIREKMASFEAVS